MQRDDSYQKQVMAFSARLRRELAGDVVAEEQHAISPARRAAEARRARNLDRRRRPSSLRGALRQEVAKRSDTTTLKALAKKGVDKVTVLPMRAMEAIVREAVDQALAARGVGAGEEREQLAEEARRRLQKLLRSRRRAQQSAAAEQRRRLALEERVRQLTQQFQSAQTELSEARDAGVANSGVQAAVRGVLEAQGLGGVEIAALEAQLTGAIQAAQAASRSEKEELLEKRLVKLNRALEESEQALRKLASMKAIDTGVASIYDCVQGLSLEDDDAERKKELLAEVFAQNCELQLGETAEVSATAELPLPAGFEAPLEFACSESGF